MLQHLSVRDLGAIAEADVEFGAGLTVLTGETGAGKTMVLEALGLVLGGRSDAALVRTGATRAVVQARFADIDPEVAEAVADAGGELDDDGSLLLVRSVGADGRSRASAGGTSVPVGLLARIAPALLRVHGQSDRGLADAAGQRRALDRYAAADDLLAAYRAARADLLAARADLAALTGSAEQRAAEVARLQDLIDAVGGVDPQPGEDAGLRREIERLTHAEALRASVGAAQVALSGDPDDPGPDALGLLAAAAAELRSAARHDPELAALADRLAEASTLAADVAAELTGALTDLDADPARLAGAHDRLAALTALTRRFGADADDLRRQAADAAERLAQLDGGEERIAELAAAVAASAERAGAAALALHQRRQEAADRFAGAVAAELAELAMAGAQIRVTVTMTDDPDGLGVGDRTVAFGADGVDEVSLQLSAHSGAPLRPLQKAASGGELSRIMLATEVVLSGPEPVGCYVFDEVDAGVGGQAAVEVGRRLARLSRGAQVLVVTHLPQVAAFADHHLRVAKDRDGAVGRADIAALSDRAEELARMLAGLPDSELGRAHAGELLDLAARERAASR